MALPPGWSGVDLVGSAGPVDSCEPAVGTRGCPQPGLCGHLVRVHGAQWAHELAPRCPGPERAARGQPPGGQLRSEGRRPLLSFPSSTQALEPGLVSPLPGGETWARGQGGSVPQGRRSQRQGPWWASRRWRAAKDRPAEAAEGHLASEMPAHVCGGPAVACGAELARAVRAPGQCPHARPPPAVPCPTPVASGPGLRLGVEAASLSLSPAPLPPRAILALSGCPGFWQPHGLAV